MKHALTFIMSAVISNIAYADNESKLNLINFQNYGYHVKDVIFTNELARDCGDCVVVGMISYPVIGRDEQNLTESKFIAVKCRNTIGEYEVQRLCNEGVKSYSYSN